MQVLILLIVPALAWAGTCDKKPDGAYGIGCRSYTQCTNGKPTIIDCFDIGYGFVFNNNTNQCDDPNNVPPPCGSWVDCSQVDNGRYADKDLNCYYYYTCFNGNYYGHNPCPGGLVFDEFLQMCNYDYATKKPCGTKD